MVNRITDSTKAKLCLALVFITNFVLRLMVVIEERYDPVCDLEKETAFPIAWVFQALIITSITLLPLSYAALRYSKKSGVVLLKALSIFVFSAISFGCVCLLIACLVEFLR